MDFIISKLALVGPFFLLLGVLIFIHEWGHFIVARLCGVKVETFSIGFGPKVFKKKWGDTTYALSVIPLGGYVKMFGDGTEDEIPDNEKSEAFNHQTVWEKIAIVSAGPLMNLIFAFFLFMSIGLIGIPKSKTVLGDIQPESPAYQSGLRYGAEVVSVNGKAVNDAESFQKALMSVQADEVRLVTVKDSKKTTHLVPLTKEENLNPLLPFKKINSIDGLELMRVSNQVGFEYDSPFIEKGASTLEKIISINGSKVEDYHQIKKELAKISSSENLTIKLQNTKAALTASHPDSTKNDFWSLEAAGIIHPGLVIGNVRSGSPAGSAGMEKGNYIIAINDEPIKSWERLLKLISETPKDKAVKFDVGTSEGPKTLNIVPLQTEILKPNGKVEYRPTVGILPALEYLPPPSFYKTISGVGNLTSYGFEQSGRWISLTLTGFKKLFTGEVSHKTLSGVISIGKVAKDSLDVGWSYFIQIMAIISINLFLLNLLPVPVLDGGHLLFYFIEVVKGSPVSLGTRLIGQQVGLVVILSLVAYTIFNDLSRIVFSGW